MIRKFKYLLLAASCMYFLYNCQAPASKKKKDESKISYGDSIIAFIDSTKAKFYFDTAMILKKNKDYELSNKYFDLAIRSKYKDVHQALYQIGNNYFDEKNYAGAQVWYNQSVLLNPNKDFWCYHNRALNEYYLGLPASTVCANVDSAIAYGDTTKDFKVLCEEAKHRWDK
jgi:tetratricopeptide (TPR) repeat protein